MTTGAMVISWGSSVRGREAKGLEVFGRALELAERDTKSGRIHAHHEYFSVDGTVNGVQGFQIIEGELETLFSLRTDDDWLAVMTSAGQIVDDFHVQMFQGGSDQAVQEGMGRYVEQLSALGYM